MTNLVDDITTDPVWEEEQQNRLLGFEILQQMLHVRPGENLPMSILERTGVNKSDPNEIYTKVFVPKLLEKLGVTTCDGALLAIRRMHDTIE